MTNLGRNVDVREGKAGRNRLWAFIGPAVLVSVGYMDPGNWATDLEAGSRFGYQLLWVLLAANLVAVLLQSLAARLGVVSRRDLAQTCRLYYARPVSRALWVLAELAVVATDLAEVLGSAVALNLLFGIPLLAGVLMTGLDVLLILVMQHYGMRRLEALVAVMVLTIGVCLAVEIGLAGPDWHGMLGGFIPHLDTDSLYVAIGILGATVMPHNLYLHSALVQTRRLGTGTGATREALRFNLIDTALALNLAFLVNAAILVVSVAVFFRHGIVVTDLRQAEALLSPLLGSAVASALFAVALLASGQSSTVTGTLAGQIVMEGFVQMRLSPVRRRLLTRGLALVPAVVVIAAYGEAGTLPLLIASQVVLSLQLPYAIVPLIRFTSSCAILGQFVSRTWLKVLSWLVAGGIIGLNAWLVVRTVGQWGGLGRVPAGVSALILTITLACGLLLLWIGIVPLRERNQRPPPTGDGE
jgi:manganese transport protein